MRGQPATRRSHGGHTEVTGRSQDGHSGHNSLTAGPNRRRSPQVGGDLVEPGHRSRGVAVRRERRELPAPRQPDRRPWLPRRRLAPHARDRAAVAHSRGAFSIGVHGHRSGRRWPVRDRPDAARAGRLQRLPEHLQADALQLVAKKLHSALAVEGELPEDGLAAYGDEGDDLMLALARKIVAGPARSSRSSPRRSRSRRTPRRWWS